MAPKKAYSMEVMGKLRPAPPTAAIVRYLILLGRTYSPHRCGAPRGQSAVKSHREGRAHICYCYIYTVRRAWYTRSWARIGVPCRLSRAAPGRATHRLRSVRPQWREARRLVRFGRHAPGSLVAIFLRSPAGYIPGRTRRWHAPGCARTQRAKSAKSASRERWISQINAYA